jgi:hypothetical protein
MLSSNQSGSDKPSSHNQQVDQKNAGGRASRARDRFARSLAVVRAGRCDVGPNSPRFRRVELRCFRRSFRRRDPFEGGLRIKIDKDDADGKESQLG